MKQWKTKNGNNIFLVLSGRSNSYFIQSEKQNILIDTGTEQAYSTLKRNINSIKRSSPKLDFLILTHTHFDHCQSARKIKEENNCQIIVSENALDSIKNGYTSIPRGTTFVSKLISRSGRKIGKQRFGYQPFQPDILNHGNQELHQSGVDMKIIETKGHSIDSVSIILDHEIAFVGDAMFGIFRNSVFPPFADNIEELIHSWGELLRSSCHTFLPGHGKEITKDRLQQAYEKHVRRHGT